MIRVVSVVGGALYYFQEVYDEGIVYGRCERMLASQAPTNNQRNRI
jgi:hypothetical protein